MVADESSIREDQEYEKNHREKKICKDETWYVISLRWYRKWLSYVGLENSPQYSRDGDRSYPGVIDNSDIMKDNQLKLECLEDKDYELVHENFFSFLNGKYGIESPEHKLPRKTIMRKNARNVIHYVVEVFPLILKVSCIRKGTKEIEFSKELSVGELEKRIKSEFHIEDPIRIYIRINDEYENISKDSCVGDEFVMNQEIHVDIKGSNGWSYDMKRENGATASSSTGTSYGSNSYYPSNNYSSHCNSRNSSYNRGSSMPEGLRGLNNIGNTCFMNSAIQSLSNVPPLTRFFRDTKKWQSQLNTDNPLGMYGEIACSYAELIENLWCGSSTPFMPRRFKMAVGKFAPQFSGFQQQDAQELMAFLLDGLHEDLNRIRKKPTVQMKDSDGRADDVVAAEAWDNYLKRNDSIIVDYFHGQLRSELVCPGCSRVSVTFDPFCYLSLPMPSEELVTVHLQRHGISHQVKYSFRAGIGISYQEFLNHLRIVAELPKDTQLLLIEPVRQYSPPNCRMFPPSGDLEYLERQPPSPVAEQASYRSPYSFVAFEIKERRKEDKIVLIEPQGCNYTRYFVVVLKSPTNDTKEELLYAAMADRLYPYMSPKNVEETLKKISDRNKTNLNSDENYDMDEEQEEKMEDNEESNDELQWEDLSQEDKAAVGRLWFKFDKSSSTSYTKYADYAGLRFNMQPDQIKLFETKEHASVEEARRQKGVHISKCIELFTKKETLEKRDSWFCNKCKDHVRATKKFDLWSLPKVLVIHLKRFGNAHRVWRSKINTKVAFPLENFNLGSWVKNDNHKHYYNLVSVVNHRGSMGGGHYVANALNCNDNNWYNFDDSSVTRISPDQVVSQDAYVLVYVRKDYIPRPSSTDDNLMEVE